jgi:hypothetical protein
MHHSAWDKAGVVSIAPRADKPQAKETSDAEGFSFGGRINPVSRRTGPLLNRTRIGATFRPFGSF